MKVTPAHDPTDFEIGERHGLEKINIFDETATVNENGGRFAGLDRYDARKAGARGAARGGRRREGGASVRARRRSLRPVRHRDRAVAVRAVVRRDEGARAAGDRRRARAARSGSSPSSRTRSMYLDWMENIRDWCISRQLWLGHRIPVWYCPDGHITVAMDDPTACADVRLDGHHAGRGHARHVVLVRAVAVLDARLARSDDRGPRVLVPDDGAVDGARDHLPLGRADDLPRPPLRRRDPVPATCSSTRWCATRKAEKMSKSIGNVIDPLDVMDAVRDRRDALRASRRLLAHARHQRSSEDRIEGARRFCNKLWNASRFVLGTGLWAERRRRRRRRGDLALPERWILSRLARTQQTLDDALDAFEFAEAARIAYHFVWYGLLRLVPRDGEARRATRDATP